jgi:SAM-dependent methyltransferase
MPASFAPADTAVHATATTYDTIGRGYTRQRRPDPRIARQLQAALGPARSVLNVGAGAGSYEPEGRTVVAAEPSGVMLAQRPPEAAPAVRARAEALPFADRSFDAVMAVLTLHHWADQAAGLAECVRVARDRVVLLTCDPACTGFWLVDDYLPEFLELDHIQLPSIPTIKEAFGPGVQVTSTPVPVPHDCVDGFLGAFWRRPAAYLDPTVQAGISSFARLPDAAKKLERLRADLASGAWQARHGALLEREALDIGYRIVVARLRG